MSERAIASNEADVVRWLLAHAKAGDITGYGSLPIEQLRVVGACDCGCLSIEFELDAWTGADIIADALAVYPDDGQAEIILWGRGGEIVLLEIVNFKTREIPRFPDVSELRSWEQRGLELI